MLNDDKNVNQDKTNSTEEKKKARNVYKTQFNKDNYTRLSVWITPERKNVYKSDAAFRGFKDMSPYIRYLLERDRQEILMEKVKRQEEVVRAANIQQTDSKDDTPLSKEELEELFGFDTDES